MLDYLTTHVPMALWGVTRVENGRQTFVTLDEANPYGVSAGGGHPWEDSFCIRMVAGRAPSVAPDAQAIPAYVEAGANQMHRIGSYGGAPIVEPTGDLFGAICGIDPKVKPIGDALAQAAPLLSLLGQLLSMVLAADRVRDRAAAAVLEATLAAETDSLTGLYNRRAWDRVLSEEESRFRRFTDPTVTVMLDLDMLKTVNDTQGHAAGDTYIRRAGAALSAAVKSTDVVARLGGDEFGVLLRWCTEAEAAGVIDRMYAALAEARVAGSIGWAPITVLKGFPAALADADKAMYAAKAARRRERVSAPLAVPATQRSVADGLDAAHHQAAVGDSDDRVVLAGVVEP